MATTYKVLGQSNPTANTDVSLYTVPAATSTVVSTINVCNQSASAGAFRVAIRPAGATLSSVHYIAFDTGVPANDSVSITMGITLATTDVITVRANTGNISFSAFGSELS